MEKSQFLYLMTRLAVAFNEKIDKERLNIYFEFLGKNNYNKMFEAVNNVILRYRYFPKISEIQSEISQIHDDTKKIEYNNKGILSPEKSKQILEALRKRFDVDAMREKLDGMEADRFEEKRKRLKNQIKDLTKGGKIA